MRQTMATNMFDLVASPKRLLGVVLLLLGCFSALILAVQIDDSLDYDSGYESENQNIIQPLVPTQDPPLSSDSPFDASTATSALQDLHSALSTMQSEYFTLWLGKWTTAIDWTAAVMGNHVSAALYSLSHSLSYTMPGTFSKDRKLDVEAQMVENEINRYFAQSSAFFFGEDAFSIRNQAYDDMLWVVLGWLDSIRFINEHSERHYPANGDGLEGDSEWHGRQFIPAFAHRSRIFYKLAEQGWDWKLCGGGMVWNPYLLPYKNAITNQLFISASTAMYLHFPGDDNCSPFLGVKDAGKNPDWKKLREQETGTESACPSDNSRSTYNPIYLQNAINGYEWLKNSGMTNDKGLYVDGFHIKDYDRNHSKTECDERNEMVYTYNQGVILSGLRGLWEGTGNLTYLEDGHELIRNVIRATGWTDTNISPRVSLITPINSPRDETTPPLSPSGSWAGLGTDGILTELCDPYGTCSQDGQTFKGIFFHHLTLFCASLPLNPTSPGHTHSATREIFALHRTSCNEYAPWVVRNAQAALQTRDSKGRFGMWWGAPEYNDDDKRWCRAFDEPWAWWRGLLPKDAVDTRQETGLISGPEWEGGPNDEAPRRSKCQDNPIGGPWTTGDMNERGRGRTVETQGGGVAVTRAMWEFLRHYGGNDED